MQWVRGDTRKIALRPGKTVLIRWLRRLTLFPQPDRLQGYREQDRPLLGGFDFLADTFNQRWMLLMGFVVRRNVKSTESISTELILSEAVAQGAGVPLKEKTLCLLR